MSRDRTDFYDLQTPIPIPLEFCRDGWLRLGSKCVCRKCGRSFVQIVKCHRYRNSLGVLLPTKAPDPNDVAIITTIGIKAHDNGVGNPKVHMRGCPVASMPRTKHLLAGVGRA